SDKNKDRPTTSGNATVGDDVGNRRFGPPFVAYDPPTFEEAEDIFAERRHRPRISSPSSSDESIPPKGPEIKIKFSISRDGLTYARDHLVHFLAADCEIIKPVAKLLRDLKFINADDLHASKPTKGDVFVTKLGRCKIFTVFIKTKHFEKLDPIDLIEGLRNLRQSMHKHDIHSLRCAKQGDEFDDLDIQAYLLHELRDCPITITLCEGNVEVPDESLRTKIIEENHNIRLNSRISVKSNHITTI
ncbi:GSCOCG00010881001-RA-CDS, partial [Cotesia congregata]